MVSVVNSKRKLSILDYKVTNIIRHKYDGTVLVLATS